MARSIPRSFTAAPFDSPFEAGRLARPTMPHSVQPFPNSGPLANNLNLKRSALAKRIGIPAEAAVSYIVRTVQMDDASEHFEQHGSAPNFQGNRLTLCTCKHQMRASLDSLQWNQVWIAGLTSRSIHSGRHWLFCLTRVRRAFESHCDLWNHLPAAVRSAKSAHEHFLGDLFKPRGRLADDERFVPQCYCAPSRHAHRRDNCDNGWHNDIDYGYAKRYGRPSLLLGEQRMTFLWERPVIYFDEDHCRNFRKWENLGRLLGHLR